MKKVGNTEAYPELGGRGGEREREGGRGRERGREGERGGSQQHISKLEHRLQ